MNAQANHDSTRYAPQSDPVFQDKPLTAQLQELADFVKKSSQTSRPAHEVEKGIWEQMLQLGRQALALFFALCGDGDLGETMQHPDGNTLRRLPEPRYKTYHSVFGNFQLKRAVYGSREGQKIDFIPLDSRLQLPECAVSYLLQDWGQSLAVEMPYARVNEVLERLLGIGQSSSLLERVNLKLSKSVEPFLNDRPVPVAAENDELIVCTADGKGVPIRGMPKDAAITEVQDKTIKPNRKKMAIVGAVYTVAPYYRTPDAVLSALFRENPTGSPAQSTRPKPSSKAVRVSLLRDENDTTAPAHAEIFSWLATSACEHQATPSQPVILLMDGQPSLWNSGLEHFPEENWQVTEVLDLIHVASYLWKAAHLFHQKHSTEALQMVKEQMALILNSQAECVIDKLEEKAGRKGLSAKKQLELDKICGYLENNQKRMYYREYLAMGYPIASGVIEGACRHVVKDRMERSGMRWVLPSAHAMLNLRCIHLNGLWSDFMQSHIQQENLRLYPDEFGENQPMTLALTA